MRLDEYAAHDALGLAELVRDGAVTAAELAELALQAVERVDGRLNAVVGVYADAVESAAAAPAGPFGGVPTLLKDLFHGDPGRPSEAGSRLAAGWVAQIPSNLVQRVRASGMVPVGRATTSEFGVMGTTETIAAGRTCSPWSGDHMAGGSSRRLRGGRRRRHRAGGHRLGRRRLDPYPGLGLRGGGAEADPRPRRPGGLAPPIRCWAGLCNSCSAAASVMLPPAWTRWPVRWPATPPCSRRPSGRGWTS